MNGHDKELEKIGAAEGLHSWSDLKYFKSLSYSRHGRTHLFAGSLTIVFGIVAIIQQPLDQMYGEEIVVNWFYI